MASKSWGYGLTPHITIVSEDDGTYTLYDPVGKMEDLDFAQATSAIEEEAMQPGAGREYLTKSLECIEYWQVMKAAYAFSKHDLRRREILRAHITKWWKINHPKAKPAVSLSDLGLTGK